MHNIHSIHAIAQSPAQPLGTVRASAERPKALRVLASLSLAPRPHSLVEIEEALARRSDMGTVERIAAKRSLEAAGLLR